jgi:RNA polymerase sigma factor (sigma-70 family)
MRELNDQALLREYLERDSHEAFAALVARHVNKAYAIALRLSRNPHHAEEITQAVFVILARQAPRLGPGVILSGWICRTARLTAITYLRSEIRRGRREQEAHMQSLPNEQEPDTFKLIAPILDDAMSELREKDYQAVVLRFFDDKSMSEVGAALGGTEDAAKKRIGRALEKLRLLLVKRGLAIPLAALAAAVSASATQAAPATLAHSAATAALAKGAATSASVLALADSTLQIVGWLKLKVPLLGATLVAYAAGISMRELTLFETACLCAGLLLSLVLPLMLSARPPVDPAHRFACLKLVWLGQGALALAGLVLLFVERSALYATLVGAAACLGGAILLHRQLRVRPPSLGPGANVTAPG